MADNPTRESSLPSAEAVRQQLQAILESRPFATATRGKRFLTYIVEQTLAGNSESIKELVLGIEVFDRSTDFDPKVDTIVRVEAGKLRKRLEEYYANEGAEAGLRIEVPKGSYVPLFVSGAAAPEPEVTAPKASRWRLAGGIAMALLLGAGGWWAVGRFRTPEASAIPSIAVLPFLNLSSDPANEYFADGLSEELTDALCNAGGLRVAARTSAFSFKNKQVEVKEIGDKLHVGYVVEGSVRKDGDQLKVTAQLIRTDDGYHVWSGSFERKLSDVFAVQQELAGSVVTALQVKLSGAEIRRLRKAHTANQQAFDLYLQGRHALNSFAPGAVERAEGFFQRSVAADPNYALPYVGLADVYQLADIMGQKPAKELAAQGRAAVQRALACDDELAEAYVASAVIAARHDYQWSAAEGLLRRALRLNPSSAQAHYQLAHAVFAPQGRWQEAAEESRLARELDPLSPLIAMSEPWLAILSERHQEAVGGFRKLATANPHDLMALGGMGIALVGAGDYPAALNAFQQVQQMQPSPQNLAFIGWVYARMGKTAEARKILEQLQAKSQRGEYVSPGNFGLIYHGLGDASEVFRWAELSRKSQESHLSYARVHSIWDPFRTDPRYLRLLAELGLSDEQVQKNQASTREVHR